MASATHLRLATGPCPFTKARLGPSTNSSEGITTNTISIQDLMAANGHEYVDIVKMDIEGAEFEVLASLMSFVTTRTQASESTATLPIGQLLMEVHLVSENSIGIPDTLGSWVDWWEDLEALGMRAVHREDNWLGLLICGYCNYAEVSFHTALSFVLGLIYSA
jgi:cupin superfamily acireductone dioxygenase involved in methionine salvage